MEDINHPFANYYLPGSPRLSPRSVYRTQQALEKALSVLADYSQLRVWTITELEEGEPTVLGGVYMTLKGAVNGARAILADMLVDMPQFSKDESNEREMEMEMASEDPTSDVPDHHRIKYVNYLLNEVNWEIINNDNDFLGHHLRVSYGEESMEWIINWHEVMP